MIEPCQLWRNHRNDVSSGCICANVFYLHGWGACIAVFHKVFLWLTLFTFNMSNPSLIQRIDAEIEKYSLLKHAFYQMWSEGKLTPTHLQGYSKEYFQLVKAVPSFVEDIAASCTDGSLKPLVHENMKEESEHIEPWVKFAVAMGVPRTELVNYLGADKTNGSVSNMKQLMSLPFEEAVAAMYAYEAELPKISRSKIDGLKKFYNMTSADATKYFEIHEEADVRHAETWRNILRSVPAEKHEQVLAAAVKSLQAQNRLLDSVQEKYVGMYC